MSKDFFNKARLAGLKQRTSCRLALGNPPDPERQALNFMLSLIGEIERKEELIQSLIAAAKERNGHGTTTAPVPRSGT